MSKQTINRGTTAGDATGEQAFSAFGKVNDNFTELYNRAVTSASNPTVNDDSGDGYAVGTRWFNTTTGALWILKDATVGAAVWTGVGETLIQEVITAGSQASVTLTPAGQFRDLLIVAAIRTNAAAAQDDVKMRFNGDTGASYASLIAYNTGGGAGQVAYDYSNTTDIRISSLLGDTAEAGEHGVMLMNIPGYSRTTMRKKAIGLVEGSAQQWTGGVLSARSSGLWNPGDNRAITSVTFTPVTGTAFKNDCVFGLYGRP